MLGKIHHYLIEKRKVVDAFYKCNHYLASGIYIFDDSVKYIVKLDPGIKEKASRILQKNEYKKRSTRWLVFILKQIIFKQAKFTLWNDSSDKEFSGNVFLPVGSTNGYKDKKIFDLVNNKVLTVFFDRKEYQSTLNNYEYFKDYFPMPPIIFRDDKKFITIEELFYFHPVNDWKEEDLSLVMGDIFNHYLQYLNDCEIMGNYYYAKSTIDLIKELPTSEEILFIQNQIDSGLFETEFPTLKLHGDLWAANTLLIKDEKNQVLYIDWEFSKELIFFYDFFNMMWLDVYMKNRFFIFNEYVNGIYDQYFKSVFSLFNLTYDSKHRMDYFHLFFLYFYKERLVHFTESEKKAYFLQYKRLVETVER
ncbi:hypothetical protein M3175_07355 [Robertmurraya korlensis]|uniref:hypothetical protein n=1 Tax=Robertmurraya korlensis TaxID=519977 RepID=UPI00203BDD92|nr:hypothetical protein [Robertmurraya korlensis]MCM3600542.1 hypothetical protein [Robertmurraya korlensis]